VLELLDFLVKYKIRTLEVPYSLRRRANGSGPQFQMHCPISHIALCDLRLPVTFSHGKHSVIFDAEYLTHWLRSCKLIDPITNEPVAADNALKLLRPVFLPHLNDTDMQRIEVFLKRAGWLDGMGGHVS
jgi:hypothetical protein